MKRTLPIILLAFYCSTIHAQYTQMAPELPTYPIVNQPGATLAQILDTMNAHANTADTGEGGEMDQIKQFMPFWRGGAF